MQQAVKNNELKIIDEDANAIIQFSPGTSIIIDKIKKEIKLIDDNEELQLSIKLTPEGLSVNINAGKLHIHANEELNLSSKKINIDASEQINLRSGGNLVQHVEKDLLSETGGTNKQVAKVQKITATLGNVELKANDDVRLSGESVKLNCDE